MSGEAGKGDKQRPGEGYQDGYDLIDWGKRDVPEVPAEESEGEMKTGGES